MARAQLVLLNCVALSVAVVHTFLGLVGLFGGVQAERRTLCFVHTTHTHTHACTLRCMGCFGDFPCHFLFGCKETLRCMGLVRAGQWRGLSVAIKTLVFQSDSADNQLNKVASEVAIASNLVHTNIVATYSHDVCPVSENPASNSNSNNELGIYKFYLIQVRLLILGGYSCPVLFVYMRSFALHCAEVLRCVVLCSDCSI